MALVDTNCDPDQVDYPIPGNDDAIRSVRLVLNVITQSIANAKSEYDAKYARRKEQPEQTAEQPAEAAPAEKTGAPAETAEVGQPVPA